MSVSQPAQNEDSAPGPVTKAELAELASGLLETPPTLSSKYFYDEYGSELFDQICELPEYYVTRAERELLEKVAREVVSLSEAAHLAELGSGMARKTSVLLEAMLERSHRVRYSPMDISPSALEEAAHSLQSTFPRLEVEGFVCDFTQDLGGFRAEDPCLLVFLGSSIGNFEPDEGIDLLRRLREHLKPGDDFLLGVDLVKSPEVLENAYNDKQGVTAEFNRNILRAVNERFGSGFVPDSFEHVAFFNRQKHRIEMHLAATTKQTVDLGLIGGELELNEGDLIRTEYSYKYTRERVDKMLESAGFQLERWYTSDKDYVALAMAGISE